LLSQNLVEKESLVASEIYEILGIKDPHKDATIESFKKKYIERNNHNEEKVSDIDQAK